MALTNTYFHAVIFKPFKENVDDCSKLLAIDSALLSAKYGAES